MKQVDGLIKINYIKPQNKIEAIDIFHNIIILGILFYLGGYLIYQALPSNNFCRTVANSTEFIKLDIIKCYPETKDYYLSK